MAPMAFGAAKGRLKVAAVLTAFTYRSHAHVLLENFLEPYLFNGKLTTSGIEVVSFYVDQFSERDMAREVAAKYNIKIYPTIPGALCLGGEKLAVDGVLSIGEHGKYPLNEKGQQEYPRKRFFDEIVAVFRRSGRVAPMFNDDGNRKLSASVDFCNWLQRAENSVDQGHLPFLHASGYPEIAMKRPQIGWERTWYGVRAVTHVDGVDPDAVEPNSGIRRT